MTRIFIAMAIAQSSRWLLLIGIAGLASCTPSLNVQSLEANIKAQLEEQSDLKIKSVTCPTQISRKADTSFQCEGMLEPEKPFVIQVKQKDDQGQTTWEVPNSKGLLNLALLETEFQTAIANDTQTKPAVRCSSDRYRANRPGDSFDCQVKNAVLAKAKGLVEKVTVTIDPEGNVSWQQIRRIPKAAQTASSAQIGSAPNSKGGNGG
ncbi:MAG TPA: DUF4333 domain-containing protein [Coleofasciculaceae cyanobacterium]